MCSSLIACVWDKKKKDEFGGMTMLCSLLSFEGKMMLYFFLFYYFNVYIFDAFSPL